MPAELQNEIDLLALGRDTVAKVARRVAKGDCSFSCQLLASAFYEALRHEIRRTPKFLPRYELLALAVARCERAARPAVAPKAILEELTIALAMLDRIVSSAPPRPQGPPKLRVIQGGLSIA